MPPPQEDNMPGTHTSTRTARDESQTTEFSPSPPQT